MARPSVDLKNDSQQDDALQDSLQVNLQDNQQSVILMVEGMRCGSCAIAVEARLKKQPKVSDAAVNFAADIAMISWQGEQPDINQLKRRGAFGLSTTYFTLS